MGITNIEIESGSESESSKFDSDEDSDSSNGVYSVCSSSESPNATQDVEGNTRDEEEEEEDKVVQAIRNEQERVRDHPPDIQADSFVVDISFHPQSKIIAAALITGDVIVYKYDLESNEIANSLEVHKKAARAVEFNEDGKMLISVSKDKSICVTDVDSGKPKRIMKKAHNEPIYCAHVVDENLLATGDDDGTVKLWDLRKESPIFSLKEMEDYVSCIITNEAKRYLVCSSGEGTITTINVGSRKLHVQSELYEAELNCMTLVKAEKKLIVGSSKGKAYVFNWGEFGYHSDEVIGPKHSINAMIPISENIVVSGYEDGKLRAAHLFPHQQLGIVGQHEFAVENLDISYDGQFIASCSHDQLIKFWNIKYFEDLKINYKGKVNKAKVSKFNLPSSNQKNVSDFFSDMASDT
ncbi:WD repeat-containing protein 55 homolog [Ischnura elegans]|uniref:WD repeat-containing protein 55 homolog n=1 Tax=Ischnura elegans TaxID=197161 RepID=UPI001ED8918A|nr:WD repeat-containing protein 55 homolog [Ischnura elegans]